MARSEFEAVFGLRNDETLRRLLGADIDGETIRRIGNAKEERFRHLIADEGARLTPGAQHWLNKLATDGWKQAIASSAPRANAETILRALNIGHYFESVITGDDVVRGKPDPQIFTVAAAQLSVKPACCIVVEDAPPGLQAARAAGMKTVGVLTTHRQLQADIVVSTLDGLPEEAFSNLLNSTMANRMD